MNPTTKEHWVYKRFFESKGVDAGFNGVVDDVCYIHTTYLDNEENLDPAYFKKLDNLQYTNKEKYNHVVMGGWLKRAEGVIFENWEYGDFVDTGYTYYGMDFGYSIDPDALVKVSIDNKQKKLYLKLLIYNTGNSTPELARKILQHKIKGTIIADSAEPRLISDLRAAGVDIQPVRKFDGSIRAGIKTMKEYMLIVDHRSPEIAKELNNYSWSDRKSEVPVDDYNHALDAIRYVLLSVLNYRPLEVF
jgi:phage terminase large subunit